MNSKNAFFVVVQKWCLVGWMQLKHTKQKTRDHYKFKKCPLLTKLYVK